MNPLILNVLRQRCESAEHAAHGRWSQAQAQTAKACQLAGQLEAARAAAQPAASVPVRAVELGLRQGFSQRLDQAAQEASARVSQAHAVEAQGHAQFQECRQNTLGIDTLENLQRQRRRKHADTQEQRDIDDFLMARHGR